MIYKLHSLNNDFLISDQILEPLSQNSKVLCERKTGFGADGLICYKLSEKSDKQAIIHAYLNNFDGSSASFSGNGFSCLAKLIFLLNEDLDTLVIHCNKYTFNVRKSSSSTVLTLNHYQNINEKYSNSTIHEKNTCFHIDVGNEHAIIFDSRPSKYVESHFESLENYPNSINVDFVEIMDASTIALDVIERGCGRTQACSSAALASTIVGHENGLLKLPVRVQQKGGNCIVSKNKNNYEITLNPVLIGKVEYEFKQ
ncbi:MAG: diaminopimelate epimerase [Candidatus Cloacimonetes bacterium]|nr:diaminopimelate epimerase [Candidatus Cloacimonadota bacterium]